MSLLTTLKNYYRKSPQNKTQMHIMLSFIILPTVGMLVLLAIALQLI